MTAMVNVGAVRYSFRSALTALSLQSRARVGAFVNLTTIQAGQAVRRFQWQQESMCARYSWLTSASCRQAADLSRHHAGIAF